MTNSAMYTAAVGHLQLGPAPLQRAAGLASRSVSNGNASNGSLTTGSLTTGPVHNPHLENAAHQFEASLMHELLQPLEHDPLFSDDDSANGSGGALQSFAGEALSRAISDRGGFGIARKILDQLEKTHADPTPDAHSKLK